MARCRGHELTFGGLLFNLQRLVARAHKWNLPGWARSRILHVQYQNIRGHDIAQFKDMATQVVGAPAEYASGEVIYPYERAK